MADDSVGALAGAPSSAWLTMVLRPRAPGLVHRGIGPGHQGRAGAVAVQTA
jgi:hypothetical protein